MTLDVEPERLCTVSVVLKGLAKDVISGCTGLVWRSDDGKLLSTSVELMVLRLDGVPIEESEERLIPSIAVPELG